MLSTPSLVLFFFLGLVFGCWRAYRLLITNRHPSSVPSALYKWEGMRLSSWKHQPQVSWAILIHLLATIALAAAALYTARKPSLFNRPPFTTDKTMVSLDWIIEGGSMAIIGYLLGALLAFPLASFEKKPVTYAVSEEGMIYGKSLMPWAWFSHFHIDRNQGLLLFYSALAQDLPSFMVSPPPELPLDEIAAVPAKHLPQALPKSVLAWYRTKSTLVPQMALLCLPLVVLGWLAARFPQRELALFSIALCMAALVSLGGNLIALYGFGTVNTREKRKKAVSN